MARLGRVEAVHVLVHGLGDCQHLPAGHLRKAAGTSAVHGLPDVLHIQCSFRCRVHLSGSYQECSLIADPQDPREGTHTLGEPVLLVQDALMPKQLKTQCCEVLTPQSTAVWSGCLCAQRTWPHFSLCSVADQAVQALTIHSSSHLALRRCVARGARVSDVRPVPREGVGKLERHVGRQGSAALLESSTRGTKACLLHKLEKGGGQAKAPTAPDAFT